MTGHLRHGHDRFSLEGEKRTHDRFNPKRPGDDVRPMPSLENWAAESFGSDQDDQPEPAKGLAILERDNLTLIPTIDDDMEAALNAMNVHKFSELAGWDMKKAEDMAQRLGISPPNYSIVYDWVHQAFVINRDRTVATADSCAHLRDSD